MTQNKVPGDTTDRWFAQLFAQMQECRQRRLLSCQGLEPWCAQIAQAILAQAEASIILSNQSTFVNAVPFAKSETLLGQETGVVIVDLFQGLNADVLCIAAGLVRAGGLLVLLSPEPGQWQRIDDQYAIWQNDLVSPEMRFIDYFFEKINADTTACIQLRQGHELPAILPMPQASMTTMVDGKTRDQMQILKEVDTWLLVPNKEFS